MIKSIRRLMLSGALFLMICQNLYPETAAGPVEVKNTHILYISHLFLRPEKCSPMNGGNFSVSLGITESNTIFDLYQFQAADRTGEFDLETTMITMEASLRYGDLTELRVELPLVRHWGGFMDRYIEGFHGLFPDGGLRNGGREYAGTDDINIIYQPQSGGPDMDESFYGAGDPSVFVKRTILPGSPGLSVTAGFKPHIGDTPFINSGTSDAGVSISGDYSTGPFYLYLTAGCTRIFGRGEYDDAMERTHNWLFSSAAGGGVTFFDDFFLAVQFYIHNSLYDTGVKKIDYPTVINSWALRWRCTPDTLIQVSFDEDPFTYAGTDIAVTMKCSHIF